MFKTPGADARKIIFDAVTKGAERACIHAAMRLTETPGGADSYRMLAEEMNKAMKSEDADVLDDLARAKGRAFVGLMLAADEFLAAAKAFGEATLRQAGKPVPGEKNDQDKQAK